MWSNENPSIVCLSLVEWMLPVLLSSNVASITNADGTPIFVKLAKSEHACMSRKRDRQHAEMPVQQFQASHSRIWSGRA